MIILFSVLVQFVQKDSAKPDKCSFNFLKEKYIGIFYFLSVGFPLFSLPKIYIRSIMSIDFIIRGTLGKIVKMYTNIEVSVYLFH